MPTTITLGNYLQHAGLIPTVKNVKNNNVLKIDRKNYNKYGQRYTKTTLIYNNFNDFLKAYDKLYRIIRELENDTNLNKKLFKDAKSKIKIKSKNNDGLGRRIKFNGDLFLQLIGLADENGYIFEEDIKHEFFIS